MVKKIDEVRAVDDAPEHIGWMLWQACAAWKRRFGSEMRNAGYPAFAEARGALLMHVGPKGIGQAELVLRTGLTKQAVQQALELLEAEDLVRRAPDPGDGRRRRVLRTLAGQQAFEVAAEAKKRIEAELAEAIGEGALADLRSRLAAALECLSA